MDSEQTAVVLARMETRIDNLDHRFDRQDEILIEIRDHAAKTNGRVTTIERERIAEQAVAKERDKVEGERKTLESAKRRRREWTVGIVVTILSIAVSALTGIVLGH